MSFAENRQIAVSISVLFIEEKHFVLALYCVHVFRYKEMSFEEICCVSAQYRNASNFLLLLFFNYTISKNCLCSRGIFTVCLMLLSCCLLIQLCCHCCRQLTNLVELGKNVIRVQSLSAFLNFLSCVIK
jgi:hypothetical protein